MNAPKQLTAYEKTELLKLIDKSDDADKHKKVFLTVSKALIKSHQCRLTKDSVFSNFGGWLKSTTTYKNEPVYFTYCNPSKSYSDSTVTAADRIYLDVNTGKTFK